LKILTEHWCFNATFSFKIFPFALLMQAMILAAGFGTRLLPHTLLRPKPLFPILNQPLLLLTIARLQRAGFDHIVVNCHHLRNQIVRALQQIPGVLVQEESSILGTGGGLRLALARFRDEPVLVSNGDIYHTIDYRRLYEGHMQNGGAVTMAMHDCPRFNTVAVRDGHVYSFDDRTQGQVLAFTGLHVLEPRVLEGIPADEEYSIIDGYRRLLEQGERIVAARVDDGFWTDMGTVEDYLALHGGLLTGRIPLWPELQEAAGRSSHDQWGEKPGISSRYCLSDTAKLERDVTLRDWVCVGDDAVIGRDVSLQRSVVWDGVRVACGRKVVDQLVAI
jgi:mannose-1-phosphate guanylyltransferase